MRGRHSLTRESQNVYSRVAAVRRAAFTFARQARAGDVIAWHAAGGTLCDYTKPMHRCSTWN